MVTFIATRSCYFVTKLMIVFIRGQNSAGCPVYCPGSFTPNIEFVGHSLCMTNVQFCMFCSGIPTNNIKIKHFMGSKIKLNNLLKTWNIIFCPLQFSTEKLLCCLKWSRNTSLICCCLSMNSQRHITHRYWCSIVSAFFIILVIRVLYKVIIMNHHHLIDLIQSNYLSIIKSVLRFPPSPLYFLVVVGIN